MTDRAKNIVWKLAKAAIGLAIFAWVVYKGRVSFGRISEADPWLVAGGFAALLVIPVAGWFRWWLVVRAQAIPLSLYEAFRLQMIGVLFNNFLLGSVGGDALKVYYLATGAGAAKKPAAVMTVGLDRLYGVVALFLLIGSQIPFAWDVMTSGGEIALFVGIAGGLYIVGFLGAGILLIPGLRARRRRRFERWSRGDGFGAKVARAVDHGDEAVQEIARKPITSLVCIGISLAAHVATVAAFFLFGRALGDDSVSFGNCIVLAPLALAFTGLPIMPLGGLGAGEYFASQVFGVVGSELWLGGTVLFLWRMALLVPAPLGFVYFVLHRKEFAPPADEADEADKADEADEGAGGAEGPGGGKTEGGARSE